MVSHRSAITLQEALTSTPTFAQLLASLEISQRYLNCIKPVLGMNLASNIAAGPIDDTSWCLVVKGNSIAAKLRQMLPELLVHLQAQGHPVLTIRLRVIAST